jgi:hypothetical protein
MVETVIEQDKFDNKILSKVRKMMNHEFPVASLAQNDLKQIKSMEEKLRDKTGHEIVLIAYENKHEKR